MFWKRKANKSEEKEDVELGDGNAVFLGVGTYEEYEKESEEERAWSSWLSKLFKS